MGGRISNSFTTGLLLGIGETECDRLVTLETIATIHQRWGHIQEVILQPYNPGKREQWQNNPFDLQKLPLWLDKLGKFCPQILSFKFPRI